MKNKLILFFTILFFSASVFAQSVEEQEAKKYANKVLYTVKKNDLEGFKKLAITLPDWEKMMAQSPKLTKSEKQDILAAAKVDIAAYHERKKFDRIQKTVKREFIDWSQIKIESITHAIEKRGTVKVLAFNIYFEFEKRHYIFNATDCIKTLTGWKMAKGADLALIVK